MRLRCATDPDPTVNKIAVPVVVHSLVFFLPLPLWLFRYYPFLFVNNDFLVTPYLICRFKRPPMGSVDKF